MTKSKKPRKLPASFVSRMLDGVQYALRETVTRASEDCYLERHEAITMTSPPTIKEIEALMLGNKRIARQLGSILHEAAKQIATQTKADIEMFRKQELSKQGTKKKQLESTLFLEKLSTKLTEKEMAELKDRFGAGSLMAMPMHYDDGPHQAF